MKTTFKNLFRLNPALRAEVLAGYREGRTSSFNDSRAEFRENVNALRQGLYLDECSPEEMPAAAWAIGRDLRLAREQEREASPDIGRELARYGFLLVGTGGNCTAYEFQGEGWRTLLTLPNDPMAPTTMWDPIVESNEDRGGTPFCREYPNLSTYLESQHAAFLQHIHTERGGN